MTRINLLKIIAGILILTLAACGGGGGGGGGSSTRSAPTGIRILHGAIDVGPVDINASESGALTSSSFADSSLYAGLNTGQTPVTLSARVAPGTPLFSQQIPVEKNQHYSLLLFGDQEVLGVHTSLLSDASVEDEIEDGSARVRIVHALGGAASLDGEVAGVSLGRAQFGGSSEYVTIPAGSFTTTIRRTVDQSTVSSTAISAESGGAYSIFVSGEIGYFSVARVLKDN